MSEHLDHLYNRLAKAADRYASNGNDPDARRFLKLVHEVGEARRAESEASYGRLLKQLEDDPVQLRRYAAKVARTFG